MNDYKFKMGDIICISDEKDLNYSNRSLYQIVGVAKEGYYLYSMKLDEVRSPEYIQRIIDHGKKAFPELYARHTAPKDFIESAYRIANKTEILLYGTYSPKI